MGYPDSTFQAFNPDDEDGSKGATAALKLWDKEIKSAHQKVKKAQADLVKETNRMNSKAAKDADKARRKKAAAERKAVHADAAEEDDGDAKHGLDLWPLYTSIAEIGQSKDGTLKHRAPPVVPSATGDWSASAKTSSLLHVEPEDASCNQLPEDAEPGTYERIAFPDWEELCPSAATHLDKAMSMYVSHVCARTRDSPTF